MGTTKKRTHFFDSEEGLEIRQELQFMAVDSTYNTIASYTTDTQQYPDNLMPFVDKHMNYINAHPKLDTFMYIANIRLMTRIR
jgi:hypothetical protein